MNSISVVEKTENSITVEAEFGLFSEKRRRTFQCSPDKFLVSFFEWRNYKLIQEAFPYLDDYDREWLLTGMTNEEQDQIFSESY